MRREWGAGPRQLPVRACLLVVSGGERRGEGGAGTSRIETGAGGGSVSRGPEMIFRRKPRPELDRLGAAETIPRIVFKISRMVRGGPGPPRRSLYPNLPKWPSRGAPRKGSPPCFRGRGRFRSPK